jgi:ribonuclease-3
VELEIAEFILMSRGEEIEDVKERRRVQAETLEALVGAIYRDRGFEVAKEVVERWFGV